MSKPNQTGIVTIVPIIPGVQASPLIDVARTLQGEDGKIIILSVVEVPGNRSLSEGASIARRRRELLRRIGGDLNPERVELSVRAARSFEDGVREAVTERGANHLILGWRGSLRYDRRFGRSSLEGLISNPPCDITVFRGSKSGRSQSERKENWPPRNILLPVRGGLHADLATTVAQQLSKQFEAALTVLRIQPSDGAGELAPAPRGATLVTLQNESVAEAIVRQAHAFDLVILGASARSGRNSYLLGRLPEEVADHINAGIMIVKTKEPLSAEMFGIHPTDVHSVAIPAQSSISTVVDQWFAENTFHSHEFEDIDQLVTLKRKQDLTISVVLPALNEAATIGKIISTIKQRMMLDFPLVDELLVMDSDSTDRTAEIARSLDVPVYVHQNILSEWGSYSGKGEGLWKSLYMTQGDIVVWIDSDITDFHPKFVYGLLGPLLTQPRIEFVKGYYRRPLKLGGELLTTGGGRVTELTARPMINLFYPLLSGLVQPLAGEMAGRRHLLEQLPMFTGYGVETGLLIDILEQRGLDVIAQTDLENRIHRNQDMISLSKMAFAIIQVVIRRLESKRQQDLLEDINTTMKLIHYSPDDLFLEVKEIREHERPPMSTVNAYLERAQQQPKVLVPS